MDGADLTEEPRLAGWGAPPERSRWNLKRPDDRQNPLPTVIAEAYEQPVVRHSTPIGPYYMVGAPEGVKRILVDQVENYPKTEMERRFFAAIFGNGLLSSEGETWRGHRRTMAPAFAPPSVASYAPAMAEEALAFCDLWDQAPPDEAVDVARDMTRLTFRIISRTMFSADGADLGPVMEEAVAASTAALRPSLADFLPLLGALNMKARERRMTRIFAKFDAALAELIAQREAAPPGGGLLSRLLAARDSETGAAMTAKEVRDQMLTVFVAGHETTAVAAAWIWYVLSQHPKVEAKLHAELRAVLGGRAPTHEDLETLVYTRMVAQEAMRLYPPAPGISARRALAADEVCGVKIPKGATVVMSPWVTHRHRAHWERPDRFEPERFARESGAGRHRFAYFPFGAGPRICIGMGLAMSEAMIILAVLAQRYSLTLAPGHAVELQHNVTMRPRGGLPMIIRRRRED